MCQLKYRMLPTIFVMFGYAFSYHGVKMFNFKLKYTSLLNCILVSKFIYRKSC